MPDSTWLTSTSRDAAIWRAKQRSCVGHQHDPLHTLRAVPQAANEVGGGAVRLRVQFRGDVHRVPVDGVEHVIELVKGAPDLVRQMPALDLRLNAAYWAVSQPNDLRDSSDHVVTSPAADNRFESSKGTHRASPTHTRVGLLRCSPGQTRQRSYVVTT